MSLHSPAAYTIPAETIRVARAAFPNGNLYMHNTSATRLDRSASARPGVATQAPRLPGRSFIGCLML